MFVTIRSCELVNSVTYLEQDLDYSVDHAHPPAQEGEEWEDELDEVVGQRLEAMKPPRGPVHVVGHRVRNWLGLGRDGGAESEKENRNPDLNQVLKSLVTDSLWQQTYQKIWVRKCF